MRIELSTTELNTIIDWAGTVEGGWELSPEEKALRKKLQILAGQPAS